MTTLAECLTNQDKVDWFKDALARTNSEINKANYAYWINVIGKRIEKQQGVK
jgi:hypothetical protein